MRQDGSVLGALRDGFGRVFTPGARLLLRLGLSPSAVTVGGTLGVVVSASWFLGTGRWVAGPFVVAVFLLADGLDGIMARESGGASRFGAFLDSTMDRIADGVVFLALGWWCVTTGDRVGTALTGAVVVCGFVVSYARARAEVEGWDASVGPFERADRLVVGLAGVLAVGLGAPGWVLWVALGVVVLGSCVTIARRIAAALAASRADTTASSMTGGAL